MKTSDLVNYPKYIVIYPALRSAGLMPPSLIWHSRALFTDVKRACRFAERKGGRVFGLNPEYRFKVEVEEAIRDE